LVFFLVVLFFEPGLWYLAYALGLESFVSVVSYLSPSLDVLGVTGTACVPYNSLIGSFLGFTPWSGAAFFHL